MRVLSTPATAVATLLRAGTPAPVRLAAAGLTADFLARVAGGDEPLLTADAQAAVAQVFGVSPSALLHRGVAMAVRGEGTTPKRLPFTASTDSVDRYGDIVDQGSWKLDLFKSNPVMPWGHDYYTPPIGTVEDLTMDPDLGGVACFDHDDPFAANIAGKYDRGVLRAFSVGFRPGRSIPRSQLPKEDPRFGERGYVFYDCELLEISAVSIPANPDALAAKGWPPALTIDPDAIAAEVVRYLRSEDGRGVLGEIARQAAVTTAPDPDVALRAVFGG